MTVVTQRGPVEWEDGPMKRYVLLAAVAAGIAYYGRSVLRALDYAEQYR